MPGFAILTCMDCDTCAKANSSLFDPSFISGFYTSRGSTLKLPVTKKVLGVYGVSSMYVSYTQQYTNSGWLNLPRDTTSSQPIWLDNFGSPTKFT